MLRSCVHGLRLMVFIGSVAALVPATPIVSAQSEPTLKFALIGDLPYTLTDDERWPNLMEDINAAEPAFVAFDGDFKSDPRGSAPTVSSECTDELFLQRRDQFNEFESPFIFVPGDNEWTDCDTRPASAPPHDPLERLAQLRQVFFPTDQSLGQQ